jgi:hypothetical protein
VAIWSRRWCGQNGRWNLTPSVFSAERANYYRCLQTLLLLSQEEDRQPLQYLNAFVRMYGAEAVEAASGH